MGFFDFVTDVYASLATTEVYAESPDQGAVKGGSSSQSPASKHEEGDEEGEANKEDAKKAQDRASSDDGEDGGEDGGEEGGEEEPEEEEEEEEEEPEDPKPKIEEECMSSKQCASYKHHYDECAERVQKQQDEDGKAKEDCVEEFFHLMHCASACAAPKLWAQLK